jgi:hypothetical protein
MNDGMAPKDRRAVFIRVSSSSSSCCSSKPPRHLVVKVKEYSSTSRDIIIFGVSVVLSDTSLSLTHCSILGKIPILPALPKTSKKFSVESTYPKNPILLALVKSSILLYPISKFQSAYPQLAFQTNLSPTLLFPPTYSTFQ